MISVVVPAKRAPCGAERRQVASARRDPYRAMVGSGTVVVAFFNNVALWLWVP
jgi:hypothetical protein